jgi:hypothetical protein
VILYVCVAGYLPFDDDNVAVLFNYIKAGDYEIPESVRGLGWQWQWLGGVIRQRRSVRFEWY